MTTPTTTSAPPTIAIETPLDRDGRRFETEEIPLPPAEHWAALGLEAPTAGNEAGVSAAAGVAKPALRLDFVVPADRRIDLGYPFELDGRIVDHVIVRRLTGGQLMAFSRMVLAPDLDNADYAGFLVGLPGPVIRGMEAEDSLNVIEAALDFLPFRFQTAVGWRSAPATSAGGEGSA